MERAVRTLDDRDHVVVMRDVAWSVYQTLLAARGTKPGPRLAYLDGSVEIMTTSRRHEIIKMMLGRLLDAYVEEAGGQLNATGRATLARDEEEGAEPDNSYFLGELKAFPDLVIEVVHAHRGLDKLEIYRRMGVAEVWIWIDGGIAVHRLERGRYRAVTTSHVVPGIDLGELAELVRDADDTRQLETIRRYRAALRRRLAKPRKRPHRRP